MAKVTPYVQGQLASSLGYVPSADTSGVKLAESIGNASNNMITSTENYLHQKYNELKKSRKTLQNVNDTMAAYSISSGAETELYSMIDEVKKNNLENPYNAIGEIQKRGQEIIDRTMLNQTGSVQEKMAGILTNSLRGKVSETHSWALAQDTANAKGKIQNIFASYYTQAASSPDITRALSIIGKLDSANQSAESKEILNSIKWTYGGESVKEVAKAQKEIAGSYVLGMLDRGETNQAKVALESGQFDKYLNPEDKHKYMNMINTINNKQERQAKLDNMFEIYDIKANAVYSASQGKYSVSQADADNKRIMELGGKPTISLVNNAITSDKLNTKEEFNKSRNSAVGEITQKLGSMLKNGKVDPHSQLKDIIEFQNLVESKKAYLTPKEYAQYMTKINEPMTKKIKNMSKNIFGMPNGEIAKKDPYGKSYLAIYNFAEKAYAGKDNRSNAIHNMISDFVRYANQTENKYGQDLTENQAQNICNKVIADQRRRTNPHLNNIPESGRIMKDKNGRTVKMYPNGKYEVLK